MDARAALMRALSVASDTIKTRPGDSTDIQFYMARGRQARSDAARDLMQLPRRSKPGLSASARPSLLPICVLVLTAVALRPALI